MCQTGGHAEAEWTCQSRVSKPGTTHPVEHVCPALHGDALKHRQHGEQEVVKISDAVVGTVPAFPALCAVDGALAPMSWDRTWSWFLLCYQIWDKRLQVIRAKFTVLQIHLQSKSLCHILITLFKKRRRVYGVILKIIVLEWLMVRSECWQDKFYVHRWCFLISKTVSFWLTAFCLLLITTV